MRFAICDELFTYVPDLSVDNDFPIVPTTGSDRLLQPVRHILNDFCRIGRLGKSAYEIGLVRMRPASSYEPPLVVPEYSSFTLEKPGEVQSLLHWLNTDSDWATLSEAMCLMKAMILRAHVEVHDETLQFSRCCNDDILVGPTIVGGRPVQTREH